jgi:2-dehydro-3-deoxyphosphogluconate aldolase/(4S)-4-hydroxy-2-oxoglutarate aldolase
LRGGGGDTYIRSIKAPLPQVPLIAAGGVNQLTALNFILSGATALGVGRELIPRKRFACASLTASSNWRVGFSVL